MTAPAPNPISMRERLRTDYHWTERQRQVLDLMARGKTNGEIGEALGISLDGAKWHVSEILSKLQAESREEAAEYWRRYNGLAPRFARVFRGVVGTGLARWLAIGGLSAVAVGVAVALAVLLWDRGGDEDSARADITPAATTTTAPGGPAVQCPGPQELCDFALETEAHLKAKDYAAIARGSLEGGLQQQAEIAFGGEEPRLVSIGCPFGAVAASCEGSFSLVFTSLAPQADWRGVQGLLLLRFEGAARALTWAFTPTGEELRRVILAGGLAQQPCNLSGIAPDQSEATCSRSTFYPFGSPFVPGEIPAQDSFRVADPTSPPTESVMFIATGCWGCEGYDRGISRVITRADGTVSVDEIPEPPLEDGETRTALTVSADGSVVLAAICRAENCGPLGPEPPQIRVRVVKSTDGGFTWTELARYDTWANPGFAGSRPMVSIQRQIGSNEWEHTWELLEPREPLVPPAGLDPKNAWPLSLPGGAVGWGTTDRAEILQPNGSVYFSLPRQLGPKEQLASMRVMADGRVLATWSAGAGPLGGSSRYFVALYEVGGKELWVRELDQQLQFGIGHLISADLALANVQASEPMPYGQLPAFVDLQAGVIHPVGGPFGQPPLQGRNSFAGFIKGAVAKVAGAGDCLNVRAQASMSAPIVRCFVDGVLLRDLGETADADGVRWLKVATPDGREGWASTQFLER